MIVEGVDPRDIAWEVDWPAYRVYFWSRPSAPAGLAQEQAMWCCDEYRLTEAADVQQVFAWARSKATADQTFVLYAESGGSADKGLIRLWGVAPSQGVPQRIGVSTP